MCCKEGECLECMQIELNQTRDQLTQAQAERDALKSLLKKLEWASNDESGSYCPACGKSYRHNGTHKDECQLAAALKGDA